MRSRATSRSRSHADPQCPSVTIMYLIAYIKKFPYAEGKCY